VSAEQTNRGPDYPPGQCTWFAAQRFAEVTGSNALYFPRPNNRVRHAKVWPQLAEEAGLTVRHEPKAGAVAVFLGGHFTTYGHVGYVESIDGDTMRVSQHNWPHPLAFSIGVYNTSDADWFIYPPETNVAPKVGRSATLSLVTTYNPEVGQNDADPWTGAAGKRMAEGMMALSRDLLAPTKAHPEWRGQIPYGTRVQFSAPGQDARCNQSYVVQDTMNKRYTKRGDVFRVRRKDNFSCRNVTITW